MDKTYYLQTAPQHTGLPQVSWSSEPANKFWTESRYRLLLNHLNKGNDRKRFGLSMPDKNTGQPMFAHNKSRFIDDAIDSTWKSICDPLKPYSVCLLGNKDGTCTWAAFDLDWHKPEDDHHGPDCETIITDFWNAEKNGPELLLIEDSGRGWHLWLISTTLRTQEYWSSRMDEICAKVPAMKDAERLPIVSGRGRGCRAPGARNLKTGTVGYIFARSVELTSDSFFVELKREEKEISLSSSLSIQDDSQQVVAELARKHAITSPATRHNQLTKVVGNCYCHGKDIIKQVAERIYEEANPKCSTPFNEHMDDFELVWSGAVANMILPKFSEPEREAYSSLNPRDAEVFRITQNYARLGCGEFPFSVKRVSLSVGISFQYVSIIRKKFEEKGWMQKTGGYKPGKSATRFRWLLPMLTSLVVFGVVVFLLMVLTGLWCLPVVHSTYEPVILATCR